MIPPKEHVLVLDKAAIKEVLDQMNRLFSPYTRNISLHFDEGFIQIMVFSHEEGRFILPDGPQDVRLREDKITWGIG